MGLACQVPRTHKNIDRRIDSLFFIPSFLFSYMAVKPYLTRGRKLVYYLFLFAPIFFVLHIFLMAYMIEWEPIMPEALFTYYFAACGLLVAFLAKPAGRFIWKRKKALVRTPEQFEPAFFGVSMIPIALAASTGCTEC